LYFAVIFFLRSTFKHANAASTKAIIHTPVTNLLFDIHDEKKIMRERILTRKPHIFSVVELHFSLVNADFSLVTDEEMSGLLSHNIRYGRQIDR
jgi:hypothetical protein